MSAAPPDTMTDAMAVSAITVGTRHRVDMGDLRSLARNIADVGLLHPIVVDRSGRLIAGQRRLRACIEILGWSEVPVRVVDLAEIVRGELAENAERKDFLPSEIDAIRRALEPKVAVPRGGRNTKVNVESCHIETRAPSTRAPSTRDKIGAFAGISGRTVEKIAAVVKAAEAEPQRYGHLVAEMDRTGKATPAFRKLRMSRDEERIKGLAVAPGRYRTLIVDPAWRYDGGLSIAGRSAPGYATMTHEELLALPVEIVGRRQLPSLFVDHKQLLRARTRTDGALGLRLQDDADMGEAALRLGFIFPEPNRARPVRRSRRTAHALGFDLYRFLRADRRAQREA